MARDFQPLLPALISLLLQLSPSAQTAGTAKASPTTKPDPCSVSRRASYEEGLKQGKESASQDSWNTGFSAGMLLEQAVYSVKVSDSAKVQDIAIVVEDIDGSTSYQFAAAEVIRTFFSDMLSPAASAALTLHIGGTKAMHLDYGDVQSIEVEVTVPANQTLTVGSEKRLLYGRLRLADDGGTLKGYSQSEKTQAVREYIYKVLSEYKDTWDKAAPKPPQK